MITKKQRRWLSRIVLSGLFLAVTTAFALEPPTKEQLTRYRSDGTLAARIAQAKSFGNHLVESHVIERLKYKMRFLSRERRSLRTARATTRLVAAPPRPTGLPTTGTVRIFALLIAFSDYAGITPNTDIDSKLFADGSGVLPYDSLRNFYRRSSYDQLEFQGDVLGWYTTAYTRDQVPETSTGRANVIKEALDFYDQQGHDFTQYDNDGDGDIDYFCVLWTGPHGEWSSFWWGYYTSFTDPSYTLDGKTLSRYSWQWELYNYPSGIFTPKVITHETGHALGIPDYYDYDDDVGPLGGVGNLDIMDSSGDHNCFSKFMLDWITPTVVSSAQQGIELRASGAYPDALLFMPDAVPGQIFYEYFMIQNRTRTGNDTGLFTNTDGLIVWHVDARLNGSGTGFLYNNSYTDHKLLRLIQADGLDEIENYGWSADRQDYYQEGMAFGPSTVPNTSRYDGTATDMGIGNILGSGSPMTLDVFDVDAPPTCGIANISTGQLLYGTVQVDVDVDDDVGISRVELYVGNTLMATETTIPVSFQLDTKNVSNGSQVIRALAYDSINQTASSSVSVTVDNIYAPQGLYGTKYVNRSVLFREYVNVLTWVYNPSNISVTKYRVYWINGGERQFLAEISESTSSTSYRYFHRRVEGDEEYTYEVVAVGSLDREGEAGIAVVR